MTLEDGSVGWFRPRRRALFPIAGIHVSASLRRRLRQVRWEGVREAEREPVWEIRFDTSFETVMRSCLRPDGNWISEDFIKVYTEIHREGWGHSGEVWSDGRLIGGVYGIAIGTAFCAESMFHRETDASKVALWAMVEVCRELGFTLFDAQIINPHLASLGAYTVSDKEYTRLLAIAQTGTTYWSFRPEEGPSQAVSSSS